MPTFVIPHSYMPSVFMVISIKHRKIFQCASFWLEASALCKTKRNLKWHYLWSEICLNWIGWCECQVFQACNFNNFELTRASTCVIQTDVGVLHVGWTWVQLTLRLLIKSFLSVWELCEASETHQQVAQPTHHNSDFHLDPHFSVNPLFLLSPQRWAMTLFTATWSTRVAPSSSQRRTREF